MDKFVIIPEKGERNLLLLLPLVESIRQNHEGCEINIIHSEQVGHQLQAWPHPIKFLKVNESDFGPVSSIKLAAQAHDLFNITHSLCFRSEVGVLQFTKALKAKNRLGWKSLVNDVFFTESVLRPGALKGEEIYFHLWRASSFGKKLDEPIFQKNEIAAPENFFKDTAAGPFLFLSLEDFPSHVEFNAILTRFVDAIKDTRLILWEARLDGQNSESFKELRKQYPDVIDASEVGADLLHHYILRCRGLVTNSPWQASLASYFGVESFFLTKETELNLSLFKFGPNSFVWKSDDKVILSNKEMREELSLDGAIDTILAHYSL
jgi:hypothetical protein